MANVNVTGFERHRRELARKQAEQESKTEQAEKPFDVDTLDIEEVKIMLEQSEIKFAHNTSEGKLRDKLKEAIKGVDANAK